MRSSVRIFIPTVLPLCSLAASLSTHAQLVEFRIVERTGQSRVDASDNVLDLAVQARSTGLALNQFGFFVRIAGEPESFGSLALSSISNPDRTYSTSLNTTSVVGRGGLAAQYTFLAGINQQFNGVINRDANVYVNSSDQDILLVSGSTAGASLLQTPGMDVDGDGMPDSWSGNGSGVVPPYWTFAPLASDPAQHYFARDEFVDLYHFRYTVTHLSQRSLHFTLDNVTATIFDRLIFNIGTWGPHSSLYYPHANTQVRPLDIGVIAPIPEPAVMMLCGLVPLWRGRRRPAFHV